MDWDGLARINVDSLQIEQMTSREKTEFVDTNIKLELMEDSDRFVHQYQSDAQDQHPQEAQWELPMSSERLQGNHARPYEAARGCQARELQGNKIFIFKLVSY